MTLRVVGSAAGASTSLPLLDLYESTLPGLGSNGYSGGLPYCENRGYAPQYYTTLARIIGQNSGTVNTVFNAVLRQGLQELESAFPYTTRYYGGVTDVCLVPVNRQFSIAGAVPISLMRPLRRYTLTIPVRHTVIAANRFEFGFVSAPSCMTLNGATNAGAVWRSDPVLNGGALTAVHRLVNAGPETIGFNSGIVVGAANWVGLGMRYTEGPSPTIEWLIDDVPLQTVTGDANMPQGSTITAPYGPGWGVGNAAGDTWQQAPARFVVEEV